MRPARALPALLLAAGLSTCGDDSPGGGWLRVRLSGPAGDIAGVLFSLGGGPIDSVRSSFPTLFTARPGDAATAIRAVVGGDPVSGVIAEIWVPDLHGAALYAGQVEQVAARPAFGQRDPAGYQVTIER
jgi:hypothetical protein